MPCLLGVLRLLGMQCAAVAKLWRMRPGMCVLEAPCWACCELLGPQLPNKR